jgi:hypothetical protein
MRHKGHSLCMAAVSFDRISGATVTPSEVWLAVLQDLDFVATVGSSWAVSPSRFLHVGPSRGNRVICLNQFALVMLATAPRLLLQYWMIHLANLPHAGDSGEIRVAGAPNMRRLRGEFLPFCRRHLS